MDTAQEVVRHGNFPCFLHIYSSWLFLDVAFSRLLLCDTWKTHIANVHILYPLTRSLLRLTSSHGDGGGSVFQYDPSGNPVLVGMLRRTSCGQPGSLYLQTRAAAFESFRN